MDDPKPLVSVILTVYDRLTFFGEALKSVEAQSFQDYEIVVADDSGTELARAASLASNNPRIRYEANPSPVGVALSIRSALGRARGKYIAILNDDDVWEPGFLAGLVPPLEADANRVLAFCDHAIMNADGQIDEAATDRNTSRFGRSGLREGEHRRSEGVRPRLQRRAACDGGNVSSGSISAGTPGTGRGRGV